MQSGQATSAHCSHCLHPRTDPSLCSMPEALWAHGACGVTQHQFCTKVLLVSQEVLWCRTEEGLAAPRMVACMGLGIRVSIPSMPCLLEDPKCDTQYCYKSQEF